MPDRPPDRFQTTHWTQVIAAKGRSPEARQALHDLCATYYEPVAKFVQRVRDRGHSQCNSSSESVGRPVEETKDLTHEFFAKLLEGTSLDHADRTRGRFRSYLLGAVKHFLADRHDRENALKRGGGQIQSLTAKHDSDDSTPSESFHPADPQGFPPDSYFDREWGLAVVQQAMDVLRAEAVSHGDLARFDVLRNWLVVPSNHETVVAAAQSLDMSDGAFKVAVHRLRKRFRQIVVERISATVDDPAEIQDELNYLITAVAISQRIP